jgi:hypothetical protein
MIGKKIQPVQQTIQQGQGKRRNQGTKQEFCRATFCPFQPSKRADCQALKYRDEEKNVGYHYEKNNSPTLTLPKGQG